MSLSKKDINEENSGDTCVVCFKLFEIYSIGECDHPVCYECSTRMRVLCQQNECPICRQSLSKVIFTSEKRSYRDLERYNRSEYYNKKYKIAFSNIQIQKAFYNLLDHPCSMCNCPAFRSFEALKDHVRREHEHFYCDICTDNLKIFSFERKSYNRQDLGTHRRKGDADNKSHRGHPLCQYCDCRYLDRDELFRHLRREHYYCHFCDADGSNQFYADYDSLREHFQAEHYLCEEGDCPREQFTGVFRSEIDLKAHISSVHGKSLGKLQAKQARTLQLEITLEPRNRSHHQQNDQSGGHGSRAAKGNGHQYESSTNGQLFIPHQQQYQPPPATIDAQNETEFPSLAPTTSSSGTSALMRTHMSLRQKSGPAGLARTKENFPALGGGGGNLTNNGPSAGNNSNYSASGAIVKNKQTPRPKGSMVIRVSNRPNPTGNLKQVPNKMDFPALPGKSKINQSLLEEDFIPSTSKINDMHVGAKYRSLVEDYVSVANPMTNQKLQLVQQEITKPKIPLDSTESLQLTTNDFPALSGASSLSTQTNWVKPQRAENRKSKVAAVPVYGNYDKKTFEKKPQLLIPKSKSNHSFDFENNNKKDKYTNKSNDKKTVENKKEKQSNKNHTTSTKYNENNNENKILNKNNGKKQNGESGDHSSDMLSSSILYALPSSGIPPGFDKVKDIKPPPGFQTVTLNSVGKSPNNLTFTTSLGESYRVLHQHLYLSPPENLKRNQELVLHFSNILPSTEAFEQFRFISKQFREGTYKALGFFEHCQAALNGKFDDIFPELLALLPDISKQQELYLVYSQYLNENEISPKKTQKLQVCSTCKQIVKTLDALDHDQSHIRNLNFPSLNLK